MKAPGMYSWSSYVRLGYPQGLPISGVLQNMSVTVTVVVRTILGS